MAIDSEKLKTLRDMTSAGMMDCKKALEESQGDIEKASEILREKGIIKAVKKMDRSASEGSIFSYVHHNGKIGVLVELNCETDFVARNEKFAELGKNIAMHIAALEPKYLNAEEVPAEEVQKEKENQRQALIDEGKPENVIDKILEGKVNKYLSEICLIDQPFVKEPKLKIGDLIKESISQLGENISIARFVRYAMRS